MRLPAHGWAVDPGSPLDFSWDGKPLQGLKGDTVASALLANGEKLVGRSFKYHRPRGVLTAGSEEPNALIEVGEGGHKVPNTRATVQELYGGLVAQSQNRWPSLAWDMLSANDFFSPFLGAGFYYKTFMWPQSFWEKVYEPIIRRAAGLGALPGSPDPDSYEKAFAHCDLLVIGAGPAGLMAALSAAEAGADVILAEEDTHLGGRLLAEVEEVGGVPGQIWASEVAAKLAAMPNVRVMTRTTVTGAYDGGTYGALERVARHTAPRKGLPVECFWRISARAAILAAGAIERPLTFPMNDRPGVMMAGSVRAYLNRWGVAAGKKVAVFTTGDDGHRTARDLLAAGVKISALIDSRGDATTHLDVPFYAGGVVTSTLGRQALNRVRVTHPGGTRDVFADCLAMSGGWNPSVHLTCHMGGRPVWDAAKKVFLPAPGAVPGLHPAGACNGGQTTAACLAEGLRVASTVLADLGFTPKPPDLPDAEDTEINDDPQWIIPGKGRAWLDFQNDVTVKDVQLAARENYASVEHMKRYTTQGMAPDQGKNSNIGALAVLADATGRGIPETGTTTYRPPFVPVSIGALGAGAQGKGFAPERRTTSDAGSRARGAPMIEAGLWYRPSYFPAEGETTWREACDREVGFVRQAVGVCDVSTLGKIDLQGPDAARFLDFVYANTFSTLKEGRVRYGLMLRQDGHVMDDGTTARLGPQHYVMTTTTAAAGQVMAHLDYVQQAFCADMAVRFTSATEQWAQFAVAGPKSRDLLNDLLDTPVDDAHLPYMGCASVLVGGVQGRLFRISFSGEHAYEVALPARFGASLFEALVTRAEAMGGGAYGMEALNVLRLEKGFITHAEIDGRVTAYDVGMGRMVSAKKDSIGKPASLRPGLSEPDRRRMVGLRPVEASERLTPGAHLFEPEADLIRQNSQGHVTSTGYSPTLGYDIALAFLERGPERLGEVVRLIDHMRGTNTLCEVVGPVQFDPEGGRLRG